MNTLLKLVRRLALLALFGVVTGAAAVVAAYYYIVPDLPDAELLREVRFQVPLRVYSDEGGLIAEFGEKRRDPVRYQDLPEQLIHAFISAEDDRFFHHPGVDYQGLVRAVAELILTGEKRSGGSTITMQVARNFFLSRERTYLRKLREIFLALKIEQELSKQEILELYLNKIFLGQRAYGVGAAARIYYGKPLAELSLAQMATIAGLPKAPSDYNPISNPERAKSRRAYVLGRMLQLGHIDRAAYEEALEEPVTARLHRTTFDLSAPFVAEMVRSWMVERYGEEEAYTGGYEVHTTVKAPLQAAAVIGLRAALLEYDRRHGWRGSLRQVENVSGLAPAEWERILGQIATVGGLQPALVTRVEERQVEIHLSSGESAVIPWEGLSWANKKLSTDRRSAAPKRAADILQMGDVVYVEETDKGPFLAQVPEVEGALVALDPHDGAILALSGGFDFYHSKFNRVVQAQRQPGSNFKPFIYSAALEKGFTPASLINDAPVVFDDVSLEGAWRPENYSGKVFGPTRLRVALTHSRNLVSIRLLDAIGVDYALDYVQRFGFDRAELPTNLSLALGSGVVTPLQVVKGYAVFANGGFRVEPYFIRTIKTNFDEELYRAEPRTACPDCTLEQLSDPQRALAPKVLDPRNVYQMTSILRDVIQHGTGRRALTLGRHDLAGKTGTTNDQRDAWFSGFNSDLVATAWVGFDSTDPLGRRETGGRAALPAWIEFMRSALDGVPEKPLSQPPGMVTLKIDPESGEAVGSGFEGAIFETFRAEHAPKLKNTDAPAKAADAPDGGLPTQLF